MTKTLLIDADDTLWEDNVFFERVIADYLALLEPLGHAPDEARRVLDEAERRNVVSHGYGVRSFGRSLEETYARLAGPGRHDLALGRIRGMVASLEETPPHVIDGVPETLRYLAGRHRMILFTKGNPAEQRRKIDQSGLARFFTTVEIVPEKDTGAYVSVVSRRAIDAAHGWMVGNSPRSDVNPALEAGLNAVFIPHAATWHMEHAEVVAMPERPGRLLRLSLFPELREHF